MMIPNYPRYTPDGLPRIQESFLTLFSRRLERVIAQEWKGSLRTYGGWGQEMRVDNQIYANSVFYRYLALRERVGDSAKGFLITVPIPYILLRDQQQAYDTSEDLPKVEESVLRAVRAQWPESLRRRHEFAQKKKREVVHTNYFYTIAVGAIVSMFCEGSIASYACDEHYFNYDLLQQQARKRKQEKSALEKRG